MKYELTEEEARYIEKCRDLLPEFRDALEKHAQTLYELQTRIVKETLGH